MKDGTTSEVEGIVLNERWGIDKRTVKNVTYTKAGEERTLSSSDFYLTHIPSGYLVTNAKTQKALKELVNRPDMIAEDDLHKILEATVAFWNERMWKG